MTPVEIIACITAAAQALAETAKFLQTEQGQKTVAQALSDRQAAEKALRDAGAWLEKLFTGKLVVP